jgi:GTP cyclohydrolase II
MAIMEKIEALLAEVASRQLPGSGRPYVTLSYAQSLDGCIAAHPGQPLALSGPQSLSLAHQLRAAHDAILVGIGTILADNPRLTVRLVTGRDPQPIVLDTWLRFPQQANLLRNPLPPWIAASERADRERQRMLESAGARILRLPTDLNRHVNLAALLERLGALGVNSLMVEGGSRIITSFLRERLVDLLILTACPLLVGGLRAVDDLAGSGPLRFPRLRHPHYAQAGEDLILWGELTWGQA